MAETAEESKAFLRACQQGQIAEAKALLAAHPSVLDARSTSKGYTAMHYAAMGGVVALVEWLSEVGMDVSVENPEGVTPLQVALEYKRLTVARRLQQLRDAHKKSPAPGAAVVQAPQPQPPPQPAVPPAEPSRAQTRPSALATPHLPSTAAASSTAAAIAAEPSVPSAAATTAASLPATSTSSISTSSSSSAAADPPELTFANREAAAQALAAGTTALRNGDLQRAVRLLRKAKALNPHDATAAESLREAEREIAAVLREQEAEKEACRADALASREQYGDYGGGGLSGAAASASSGNASGGGGSGGGGGGSSGGANRSGGGSRSGGGGSTGGGSSGGGSRRAAPAAPAKHTMPPTAPKSETAAAASRPPPQPASSSPAEASQPHSYKDADVSLPPPPRGAKGKALYYLALLLQWIHWLAVEALPRAARAVGLLYLLRLVSNASQAVWQRVRSKWETTVAMDPELYERLEYLFYYWRARLRWPLRLIGVLLALALAWRFPWHAYALFVVASGALLTYLHPNFAWSTVVPQPAVGAASVAACFLCWLLPYTSLVLLGLGTAGLLVYLGAWQLGAGAGTLLLVFYFLPTLALGLLGLVAWLLFLITLPRICLLLTEMALGGYYMPFHWPFLHVCLLGLVFGTADYKLLLPVGVLLTLLYFFPRSVLSLVALIVLWMLWPIVAAARQQIGLLIEQPYGPAFLDEDAKKAKEKAETPITDEARRLFERYGLGTASAPDLPNRIWQALTELGLKRSQSEASGLLGEYEGGRAGRLSAEEFLQLVAAEVALAGKTHYDVLRTHRAAMPAELKKGYRRMSLLLHPDKNARESAARAFKRVSDAYTTLSDAYTRAEYDANLDDGGTGEDGLEGGGEAAQAPSFSPDMPSGPPGLKKRKGRPPRR
jgi:hypothetical protein